jgi:hypothetical protein
MIRQHLAFLALRATARATFKLAKLAAVAAVLAAAAPVTLVAAYAATLAWLRGWPPRRLYGSALWCLPMAAAWLACTALGWPSPGPYGARSQAWLRLLKAPYHSWLAMWHLAAAGHVAEAAVTIAPPAIPLGLAAGGLAWTWRIYTMETGTGGLSPSSPVAFDLRQWRRQVRTAKARSAAPGSIPLFTPNELVVTGATIRAVQHPARPVAAIPYARLRSHQVIIGSTGTGKTSLLLRLWAGFMATALRRHAAGRGRRPLLVILDCKGGADSRRVADRARRVLRDAGARSTAIWPDEASLSLWDLPPEQLTTTLLDLIEHGTGSAAYYADVMEAIVSLAVSAPCGPPADSADFLARLDADWLATAYAASGDEMAIATIRSGAKLVSDTALRFRTLWRRLGAGFDPPGGFADADVWYCILEGTAQTSVAEAQARALVDLLANYATGGGGGDAEILLAVDEFSAVSRRLPIWQLYERARSLGLAVQVSAQSWQGLAADEDERYRIATTADGGIWLLRTPHPDPVVALAGNRRVVDSVRRLTGTPAWTDEGTSRVLRTPVVDPDLVRRLDVGQAAYVYRGGVTFVQVKRLVAAPAALPPGYADARRAAAVAAADPVAPARLPPDAGALLDEAFGGSPETGGT